MLRHKLGFGLRAPGSGIPLEDAGSLGFPLANNNQTTTFHSYLTATGLSDPIFSAAGALIVTAEIPWHSMRNNQHIISSHEYANAATGATGGMALTAIKPAERSDDPIIQFSISNGTTIVTATCTLPDYTAQRFTIGVLSDGANSLSMAVYAAGSTIGTVTYAASNQTLAGYTPRHSGFLIGTPCGISSLAPNTDTNERGFLGSVGFVGYYDGAVTGANLAAISTGQAINAVLTAANFRLARELVARTGSVAAASWATADALPAFTRTTGSSFLQGSDIVPNRDGSGNTFALNPIGAGRVWGVLPEATTATVTLSGTATGHTGTVQARLMNRNGSVHTDWTTLTGSTIAAGAWSGTMTASLTSGWLGGVEVRLTSTPAIVHRSRARCGVGYKIGIAGQSNIEYAIKQGGLGNLPSNPGAFSFGMIYRSATTVSGNAVGSGYILANPIDAGYSNNTDGLARMADTVRRYTSAPVAIFDIMQEGAGINTLQEDAITTRAWSELTELAGIVGGDLTAVSVNWTTEWDPAPAVGALIDGLTDASVTWTQDHYVRDGTPFPAGVGANIMGHTGFQPGGATTDFDTNWDGANEQEATMRAYCTAQDYSFGPTVADVKLEGGHPEFTDEESRARMAERQIMGGLRAAGITTELDPEITDATLNEAGTVITLTIDLPNGGDLQTQWGFDGTTVPVGYEVIQGFEIWENATGDPTRSGFTPAITNTGTGTAPNRTATVTITKDSGTWSYGTTVLYMPGHGLNYGDITNDNMLYRGTLYESGQAESGLGMPLLTQYREEVLAWTPDAYFLGSEDGAWWDPSDASTVWTTTGKTAHPADGGTVSVIDDKRGTHHFDFVGEGAPNLPTWHYNGGNSYLLFDGNQIGRTGAGGALNFSNISVQTACTSGATWRLLLHAYQTRWRINTSFATDTFNGALNGAALGTVAPGASVLTTGAQFDLTLGSGGYGRSTLMANGNQTTDYDAAGADITYPLADYLYLSGGRLADGERWVGKWYGASLVNVNLTHAERAKGRTFWGAKLGLTL